MRVIMVMFDSLHRNVLPPYDPASWVHAPNFQRLAERSVTFDSSYVCSMPCMPARRDFHTGRPCFLHRGWGPLEPFDDSMPQMLSDAGVYTHLCTDHYHYFEDGGATYHNRYRSWQAFRGQEGDPWVGQVAEPTVPANINGKSKREDWVNRQYQQREQDLPQSQTFEAGCDFIDRNHDQDNWFVQIECFDPHDPFVSHRKFRDLYDADPVGLPLFDWPSSKATQPVEQRDACLRNYAALVSKCDASLGEVLDRMDRYAMWDDTMLIVWTDHGFLLGEHGWWGKNAPPMYDEVSRTPFFVWDPRTRRQGEHRQALVQPAIDLAPTLLRFFGLEPTQHMLGHDLAPVIERDQAVREAAIFGYHGKALNITDGRYTYFRPARRDDGGPCYQYTLMPTRMTGFVPAEALTAAELVPPFAFTKGMSLLRYEAGRGGKQQPHDPEQGHLLFDVLRDPRQAQPLDDDAVRERLLEQAVRLMQACDAPAEQYDRLGLTHLAAPSVA